MSAKYLLLNEELFIFDPDTDDLFQVEPQHIARRVLPQVRQALRLGALEVTRGQAETAAPAIEFLCLRG